MKCAIKWIDCQGNATPDDNDAVGYAQLGDRKFPICSVHKASMHKGKSHVGNCSHVTDEPANWLFIALDK